MKTICIDFDGVIHNQVGNHYTLGKPLPGAPDALDSLAQEGVKIIIYTTRAATIKEADRVAGWLDDHDIPYDTVTAVKPTADLYIDDKAVHHTSWDKTIAAINERLGLEI